jgi:hypothetical protein
MLAVWQAADDIDVYESGWTFDHFYPIFSDSAGPCLEGWTTLTRLVEVKPPLSPRIEDRGRLAFVDTTDGVISLIQTGLEARTTRTCPRTKSAPRLSA